MSLEEFIEKQKSLLELERTEEINRSKILTECSPKILEEKHLCIRKLSIVNIFTGLYGRTIVEFENKDTRSDSKRVFSQGDIVQIFVDSSRSQIGKSLATGLFYRSNKNSIQIALDNDSNNTDELTTQNVDQMLFRLIKISSEITHSRLKAGLKYLEKRSNPQFCGDYLIDLLINNNGLSSRIDNKKVELINKSLNKSQMEAVQFCLSRPDVAIIHGPPGTGKTTVAVEIINQLLLSIDTHNDNNKNAQKILICTPSNIALDNLAEKLLSPSYNDNKNRLKKRDVLRLGHSARVMPHLSEISIDYKLNESDQSELIDQIRVQIDEIVCGGNKGGAMRRNRSELADLRRELRERELKAVRELLRSSRVIMSTLTGLRSNKSLPLNEIEFDVVLIDEASQAIEAACWLAIPRGKKLILAGDHKQLPPTVLSDEATKQGLGVSLMERLLNSFPEEEISRMLSYQYRMNENIMRWSSDTFYNSKLFADESVAEHLLNDIFTDTNLDNDEERLGPVTFIDTSGCDLYELESTQEDSKGNLGEAQLAVVYIKKLVDRFNLQPNHIGVITPYSRQVQLIRETLNERWDSNDKKFDYSQLEISTVDGFQGREKQVIVITLVRSNPSGEIGFLAEHRRLNVALTRAMRHLCIIGDSSTIEKSSDKLLQSLVDFWNREADVRSAHDYIYEFDIVPGDCVKNKKKSNKLNDGQKKSKPKSNDQQKMEEELCEKLRKFKMSDSETKIEFSKNLDSRMRAKLHELAESLNLQHKSVGEGKTRKLEVWKNNDKSMENDLREMKEQNKPDATKGIKIDLSDIIENQTELVSDVVTESSPSQRSVSEIISESLTRKSDEEQTIKVERVFITNVVETEKDEVNKSSLSKLVTVKSANLTKIIKEQESKPDHKTSEKMKKKDNRQKLSKAKPVEIPEDLDAMLEHFQSLDKICQHPDKCSTLVSVLGFNCQFCKKRFCVSHSLPEVHLCSHVNRSTWRNVASNTRPHSNSQKIKHAQLSRAMNHKLQDMTANRLPKKRTD